MKCVGGVRVWADRQSHSSVLLQASLGLNGKKGKRRCPQRGHVASGAHVKSRG